MWGHVNTTCDIQKVVEKYENVGNTSMEKIIQNELEIFINVKIKLKM